jgi:hypothetical protein
MTNAIPLTVLPLLAYNLIGYGLAGADPWFRELVIVPMPSGARWSVRLGDVLVVFAMAMLYVEVKRAARPSRGAFVNRTLSIVVFIAYVVEFVAAEAAAHSVFFFLTAMSLFDVAAGAAIRKARHERQLERLESRVDPSDDAPL